MRFVITLIALCFSLNSQAMSLECQSTHLNGVKGNDFIIHVVADSSGVTFEAEINEQDVATRTRKISKANEVYFINDRLIVSAEAEKVNWRLPENASKCFVSTEVPHINLKENFFSYDYSGTVTFYQDLQVNPYKKGCPSHRYTSNRKSEFLSCMLYDDE